MTGQGLSGAQAARRAARQILDEPRFHAGPVPRPLQGLLHAIGQALAFLPRTVNRFVSALAVSVPGGSAVVWGVLAGLLLAVVVLLSLRMTRRLLADPAGVEAGSLVAIPPSASESSGQPSRQSARAVSGTRCGCASRVGCWAWASAP